MSSINTAPAETKQAAIQNEVQANVQNTIQTDVQNAVQATTNVAPQVSNMINYAPLVLIFILVYFLLIRPQMKKRKEQQVSADSAKKDVK